jgi:hypothetical protein
MITRIRLYPFIVFCLLSCASPKDRGSTLNRDSSDSLVAGGSAYGKKSPDFKTVHAALSFAGAWVNEVYVDSIHKNRSPRKDQGIEESCINIPDSTLMTTSMVGGFHEGGPEMVVVMDGDRYQFFDPTFKTPKEIIEPLSPDRLRIGSQYFKKLTHADMEKYEWGILNEILFAGKYKTQVAKEVGEEAGKEVVFAVDGHITGLDTITYYQPHADYTGDQDLGVDRISLGPSQKNLHEYGFQFNGDTLLIYSINCLKYDSVAHECGLEQLGELQWKLHRIAE